MTVFAPSAPRDLRHLPSLWPARGLAAVVAVCRDDAAGREAWRGPLAALGATLVLEPRPGAVSERVGRPAVVVCDRYQEVLALADELALERVVSELEGAACRCEECPQAAWEDGGERWLTGG